MGEAIIKDVTIPEELCSYVQRLQYELDGYRVLMTSILRCGEFRYNEDVYGLFLNEFQKTNMQLRVLLEEIKTEYCPEPKDSFHNIDISILFRENLARFTRKDSSCSYQMCMERDGGC